MRTVLRAVLIMVLVGLILSAVAMASPVLILVAAGLIIIAWRWPGRLAAWLEHPALSWLPARLRASPRAFVTSAAAVLLLFALMIQLATIGEQPGSGEEMVAAVEGTPQPSPTPTTAPTPTPTTEPTPMPTPTPTPAPTPTPTPDPTPTPTPTPASVSRDEYLETVYYLSESMSVSMDIVGDLLQDPQLGSEQWRNRMATEMLIWRANYDDARKLVPPSDLATFHDVFVRALERYASASQDIDRLIAGDLSVADQAIAKMEEGQRLLGEATNLLTNR